jgi:hypothetical protein
VDDFSAFQRQSLVNWAHGFAGATVSAEQLVNVHFIILFRQVKRARYGANVQAVSAAFGAFSLVYGNFAFNAFAHFNHAGSALELANPAGWTVLFLDGKVDLHAFSLARRQSRDVFNRLPVETHPRNRNQA